MFNIQKHDITTINIDVVKNLIFFNFYKTK